jgi:hypothetical protein
MPAGQVEHWAHPVSLEGVQAEVIKVEPVQDLQREHTASVEVVQAVEA